MHRLREILSIRGVLVLLLFAAPTVQYRVELGVFSFAVMEPIVLFVSAVLLSAQMVKRRRLAVPRNPTVLVFAAMTTWALIARPWASNWQNGLSDVRDWFIPLLGLIAVSGTIHRDWRRWIDIFVLLVWLNAWLGIYQHATDSFRPFVSPLAAYKTGFTVSPDGAALARVSFAAGFFSHPNGFAMYLLPGLMIALGVLRQRRKRVPFFVVVVLPIALALYWTYTKASLLVAAGLISLFWLERRVKSNTALALSIGIGLMIAAAALWEAGKHVPPAFLATFRWRVGLWESALATIGDCPGILVSGNGLEVFARYAYYWQPHNLYVYLLLQYGAPGFAIVMALAYLIWGLGIRLRSSGCLRAEPALAALWIALLSYFATGLVESSLLGIESRAIFANLSACFCGLAREMRHNSAARMERQ